MLEDISTYVNGSSLGHTVASIVPILGAVSLLRSRIRRWIKLAGIAAFIIILIIIIQHSGLLTH